MRKCGGRFVRSSGKRANSVYTRRPLCSSGCPRRPVQVGVGGDGNPDIDALAAKLMHEAAKLRASNNAIETESSARRPEVPSVFSFHAC
jgi:hypothetical protein